MLPVSTYLDHGEAVESGAHIDAYMDLISADGVVRQVVEPGQELTFGSLQLTFVTAAGEVIQSPLPSAVSNDGCANPVGKTQLAGAENPESVGFLARFGSFDFLDLGDFTWNAEQALACPTNRVGVVDLYQVSHHGMDLSSSLSRARAPQRRGTQTFSRRLPVRACAMLPSSSRTQRMRSKPSASDVSRVLAAGNRPCSRAGLRVGAARATPGACPATARRPRLRKSSCLRSRRSSSSSIPATWPEHDHAGRARGRVRAGLLKGPRSTSSLWAPPRGSECRRRRR
jgi:hypothetical protein